MIAQVLAGRRPEYLNNLDAGTEPPTEHAAEVRAALRGDLHLHSDWSDGGHTIEAMARHASSSATSTSRSPITHPS